MKQTIFIAMALMCAHATTSFAQGKTPTAVITAFNQKFPNATNVKWDKENAHEYEAEFAFKGVKHSANFTDSGEWLETERIITFNQLPENVQKTFNTAHKGAVVKEVAKIETSKGEVKYEVEIKKGAKTVDLFYAEDGTEVKE